jgi:hypothetical protein
MRLSPRWCHSLHYHVITLVIEGKCKKYEGFSLWYFLHYPFSSVLRQSVIHYNVAGIITILCRNINHVKKIVAWVCEWTISTEQPRLVGEESANFCGQRVLSGHRDGSLSQLSRPEPLFFLPWLLIYYTINVLVDSIELRNQQDPGSNLCIIQKLPYP